MAVTRNSSLQVLFKRPTTPAIAASKPSSLAHFMQEAIAAPATKMTFERPKVFRTCSFGPRNLLPCIVRDSSAPASLTSPLFDPPQTQHWKNTAFPHFLTLLRVLIFFLLTFSSLALPAPDLLLHVSIGRKFDDLRFEMMTPIIFYQRA